METSEREPLGDNAGHGLVMPMSKAETGPISQDASLWGIWRRRERLDSFWCTKMVRRVAHGASKRCVWSPCGHPM